MARLISIVIFVSIATAHGYITPLEHEWGTFSSTAELHPLAIESRSLLFLLTTRLTTGFSLQLPINTTNMLELSFTPGNTHTHPLQVTATYKNEERAEVKAHQSLFPGFSFFAQKEWSLSIYGSAHGAITITITFGKLDSIGRFIPEESLFLLCDLKHRIEPFSHYALTAAPGNNVAWVYPKTYGFSDTAGFFLQTTQTLLSLFPALSHTEQSALNDHTVKVISRYYFLSPEEQSSLHSHTASSVDHALSSERLTHTHSILLELQNNMYEIALTDLYSLNVETIKIRCQFHLLTPTEQAVVYPLITSLTEQIARVIGAKQFDQFVARADSFILSIGGMSIEQAHQYKRADIKSFLQTSVLSHSYSHGVTKKIDTIMHRLDNHTGPIDPFFIPTEPPGAYASQDSNYHYWPKLSYDSYATAPLFYSDHSSVLSYEWFSQVPEKHTADFSWSFQVFDHEKQASLLYDHVTGVALSEKLLSSNISSQFLLAQQWDYRPASYQWYNTQTGDIWEKKNTPDVWAHIRHISATQTRTTIWHHDRLNKTWHNQTDNEVWNQPSLFLWQKENLSETWMLSPFEHSRYWIALSNTEQPIPDELSLLHKSGYAPHSVNKWGQYTSSPYQNRSAPEHFWSWSALSTDSRGAWIENNHGAVKVFTFNHKEQKWMHADTQGFPPPLLPPLVVVIHDDILAAQSSLCAQALLREAV